MEFQDFLNAVIDDGTMEIRHAYMRPDQVLKRDGGIAGFEACRGLEPEQLGPLLKKAGEQTRLMKGQLRYWYYRYYELQIEWVCNVVSALLMNMQCDVIITPTARGQLKARELLSD